MAHQSVENGLHTRKVNHPLTTCQHPVDGLVRKIDPMGIEDIPMGEDHDRLMIKIRAAAADLKKHERPPH